MKNKTNENYIKRFENGFEILTRSRHGYTVWSDIISLFALSIVNNCTRHYLMNDKLKDVWEERENEYLRIINNYNEKEQKIIPQMFSLLVMEYEQNPYQDLLGSMYMLLGISNKDAGQFFTPFSVCQAMAQTTIDKQSLKRGVKERGYVSINDPSVGGAATLIASAEICDNLFNRLNYKNHVLFVGQDIDVICCRMAYIQLSLLGLAGYILHGNTLTKPEFDFMEDNINIYPTPYYNMDVWQGRILFHNKGMLLT